MQVVLFSDIEYSGFLRYSGPYRLATELRKNGFSARVVDFFNNLELFELEIICQKYLGPDTLMVGFSNTFTGELAYEERERVLELKRTVEWYYRAASMIRKYAPNAKLVIGGGYAGLFQFSDIIDYWVKGLADSSIIALAEHLRSGQYLVTYPVPGSSGKLIDSDKDYPFDHFSTSTIEWQPGDYIFKNEFLPIEIARGCIFKCAFCSFRNGKNADDYLKSDETIREELIRNFELFGVTNYMICDDNFNDSIEKVRKVHRIFTSLPFKISFVAYNRIDLFKRYPEMRELLLEAGQVGAHFGIETLNHETGKKVGKGLLPSETIKLLEFLQEGWGRQVLIGASFIVGLPGESKESILKTFDWLRSPSCPVKRYLYFGLNFNPINNTTKIQMDPKKYGFEIYGQGPFDWRNEHFDGHEAVQLAYEFMFETQLVNKISPFCYPHLRNLGYSHDEAFDCSFADEIMPSAEMLERRKVLKEIYISNLLSSRNLASRGLEQSL